MLGLKGFSIRKVRVMRINLFVVLVCMVIGGFVQAAKGAEKDPIKIGFLAPTTGNFAQLGMEMVEGFKMFLDEINSTVAGRKIVLIVEDEAASPEIAVQKVRKLITHDKVPLITGILQGSVVYAIAPLTEKAEIPVITTAAGADDLTQRKASKYFMRICWTPSQFGAVAANYAYKKLGWRKAVTFGLDYSFGYEMSGAFQTVFEDLGGRLIQRSYAPVNTMDFGPYVTNFNRNADGIFSSASGAASIRLIKTMRTSGLMDKWKLLTVGSAVDESSLPALGDDGPGILSVWPYSVTLENPENARFVEKIKTLHKKGATSFMAMNYIAADWITRAIKSVNGDVENKNKFLQALHAVEIPNSLQGPLKLDKYGQVITNYYIRRIDKVGDAYQNTVIETYPMVSQFWNYDPETFLKKPVYSRDYPPCKFCE